MTLEDVLREYINGTYSTLEVAATSNGYTIDQLKYFIKKIKSSKIIPERNLYKEYLETARKNQKLAKKKGGQNGKRTTTHTQEEIYSWYKMIVEQDMTLEEVERRTGVPKSVIHENLKKYLPSSEKSILYTTYEAHKKCATNDYKNDTENNYYFFESGGEVTKSLLRSKR